MKKSDIDPLPEYFDRYINLIADVELADAFDESLARIDELDLAALERIGDATYAPGKWSVKTLVQHVADFERILGYRTLLFARGDGGRQLGVDQDLLAAEGRAGERRVEDLIAELKSVRQSTKALFGGFDERMLRRTGVNWKYEISVLAMGFAIIGHHVHHFNLIEEKYLPLAGASVGAAGENRFEKINSSRQIRGNNLNG